MFAVKETIVVSLNLYSGLNVTQSGVQQESSFTKFLDITSGSPLVRGLVNQKKDSIVEEMAFMTAAKNSSSFMTAAAKNNSRPKRK